MRVRDTIKVISKGDTVFVKQSVWAERIVRDTIKEEEKQKQVKEEKSIVEKKKTHKKGYIIFLVVAIGTAIGIVVIRKKIRR